MDNLKFLDTLLFAEATAIHGSDAPLVRGHLNMFSSYVTAVGDPTPEADDLAEAMREGGILIADPSSDIEPPGLKDWLDERETLLSGRGDFDLLGNSPLVVVSGSRQAPQPVLETARTIGSLIQELGRQLVTGHAAGVDMSAMEGFMSAGGAPISVHPAGLLRSQMIDEGLHLSPFLPQMRFSSERALSRNRMMAAMSDLVIVVHAREKSGSLAQGNYALEMGRALAVVHGSEDAAGCESLLARGAVPLPAVQPDLLNTLQKLIIDGSIP
jgi:DNA processing protein